MILSQGTKLSLGLIIVNLLPFSGSFCPLTSTDFFQITWNFLRKWSLFRYISYVKIIITEQYLETRHPSKLQFWGNLKKMSIFSIFWHFLLPKFCKLGLNDLKISGTYSFMNSTWDVKMVRIARFLHLWYTSKKMFFETFQVKLASWRWRHSKNQLRFFAVTIFI